MAAVCCSFILYFIRRVRDFELEFNRLQTAVEMRLPDSNTLRQWKFDEKAKRLSSTETHIGVNRRIVRNIQVGLWAVPTGVLRGSTQSAGCVVNTRCGCSIRHKLNSLLYFAVVVFSRHCFTAFFPRFSSFHFVHFLCLVHNSEVDKALCRFDQLNYATRLRALASSRSTWMDDHRQTGKPSWYVTSHPGQLSLAIPPGEGRLPAKAVA